MTVQHECISKKVPKNGNFLNKCPHCNHKQYSYTKECEMCRFSWLRMYNQMKGIELDTPYEKEKHLD